MQSVWPYGQEDAIHFWVRISVKENIRNNAINAVDQCLIYSDFGSVSWTSILISFFLSPVYFLYMLMQFTIKGHDVYDHTLRSHGGVAKSTSFGFRFSGSSTNQQVAKCSDFWFSYLYMEIMICSTGLLWDLYNLINTKYLPCLVYNKHSIKYSY